ncbi:cytochrome P450 [Aulographum hederae CBS 113979]|uniref:Cytochrome P450 n=1 Tax=Aulographum hederae CBS 113979 TaxID=1176131 RepID=A0A6G1H219_9PEZI|nr:cytochrome P450 [Aulographum hederae CBS 113979]
MVLHGLQVTCSPMSSVPGPKLAAMTYWYEIYCDVWLGGWYFRKIAEMHQRYDPIVRINPHKVHFNDPELIDPIFPGPSRKTNKHISTGRRTGTANSIVGTVDHDLHRRLRNTVNAFFSSASVRRLEPIMKDYMARLLVRLDTAGKNEEVVPMHFVLKACASDVITKYAFGDSFHFLDQEDYGIPSMEATDVFHLFNHAFCHFPWTGALLASISDWVIRMSIPSLTEMWNKNMVFCLNACSRLELFAISGVKWRSR